MKIQDWKLMLLSLYFQTSDDGNELVIDEDLLEELLEAVNENRPGLATDQYLS